MKYIFQHNTKRYSHLLLFISFLFVCSLLSAQSLFVDNFKMLENDLTANTTGTSELDQNGEVAALIKIITTETGFAFDGGMMGIVKTTQKVSEIWVYVPHSIQKIKIMHQKLGQIEYYFPIPIEKARTYELKLSSRSDGATVEQAVASQFVILKVEPRNAVIYIDDDEPRVLDNDGVLYLVRECGRHTYRVTAEYYMPETGVIDIGADEITKQTITLKRWDEYVDLGLSVKWGSFNIGASQPEDFGNYYAWGEINSKSSYNWNNYKFRTSGDNYWDMQFSKYYTGKSQKLTLDLSDDVAYRELGAPWRMPTQNEFQELIENCTWEWTTQNDVQGYKVMSDKPGYEGRFIFLPASGYYNGSSSDYAGTDGFYWSSSLNTYYSYYAWYLNFYSGKHYNMRTSFRYCGFSVRPVCK